MSDTKKVSRLQAIKLALLGPDEKMVAADMVALKRQCAESAAPRGSWADFSEDCASYLTETTGQTHELLPDAS